MTPNALFAYAGLARTQTSVQKITQAANRRVARVSGILGMTAVWMMTILEPVGWKTDVIGAPWPNGERQLAVTHAPG